eukprot:PITA_35926
MAEEYESIMKNDIWDIVLRPKERSVVTSKWLYKIKHAADRSIKKYKVRFVAHGFSQKEGEEYDDIFTHVARYTTICLIMALAASQGWTLRQMDVKTTFLRGLLQKEVYVEQPPRFGVHDRKTHVCGLKKALYGLKQPPALGADPLILECKRKLASEFKMKDLGLMHYFLGLKVWQNSGEIFLSQQKYVVKLLERFGMVECKSLPTPMDMNFKKFCGEVSRPDLANPSDYRQLVGALMFLVNAHPNICFVVNTLT